MGIEEAGKDTSDDQLFGEFHQKEPIYSIGQRHNRHHAFSHHRPLSQYPCSRFEDYRTKSLVLSEGGHYFRGNSGCFPDLFHDNQESYEEIGPLSRSRVLRVVTETLRVRLSMILRNTPES